MCNISWTPSDPVWLPELHKKLFIGAANGCNVYVTIQLFLSSLITLPRRHRQIVKNANDVFLHRKMMSLKCQASLIQNLNYLVPYITIYICNEEIFKYLHFCFKKQLIWMVIKIAALITSLSV